MGSDALTWDTATRLLLTHSRRITPRQRQTPKNMRRLSGSEKADSDLSPKPRSNVLELITFHALR